MPAARKPAAKAAPVEVEAVEVSPEEAATIAPAEVEGEAVEVGPDGVPTIGESPEPGTPEPGVPGESAGFDDPDTGFRDAAQPESDEDVTVIVALNIGGTRDGVPWPAIGEPITLPAAEAADYLKFGYVREVDAE